MGEIQKRKRIESKFQLIIPAWVDEKKHVLIYFVYKYKKLTNDLNVSLWRVFSGKMDKNFFQTGVALEVLFKISWSSIIDLGILKTVFKFT